MEPRSATRAVLVGAALAWSAGCATLSVRRPPPPPSPLAKAVLRTAREFLPEEEKHRPTPVDCSDFVEKVFRERGVSLPRTSAEMSHRGKPVSSTKDLRMGDLLFFSGSGGGRKVGHVAIYDNNGVFIHQADPGEGVRLESLYSDYWRKHYLKARRVLD